MTGPLIVLGWDGLDAELCRQFGLSDQFGAHLSTIETYSNPVLGEPHTYELWPSMITGGTPDEHGIHAATAGDNGPDWDSAILQRASGAAAGVVPQALRSAIGRWLFQSGASVGQKTPAYYRDNGLQTVFSEVGGRAISIPNYQTERDRRAGLDGKRADVWQELVAQRGGDSFEPAGDLSDMYDVLGREVGRRLGQTLSAAASGEPLLWTWFGLLDTVGHLAPAVGVDMLRHWYGVAASVTAAVRDACPGATVLCVSDHGLQDGDHTDYATLCADDPAAVSEIASVFDIYDWVVSNAGERGAGGGVSADAMGDVQEQLEGLGYL